MYFEKVFIFYYLLFYFWRIIINYFVFRLMILFFKVLQKMYKDYIIVVFGEGIEDDVYI